MTHASNTFHVVVRNRQRCSIPALSELNIKSKNKAPCTDPITCTARGYWNIYFNGMAINSNSRRERPSKKPMIRSLPIFVRNNDEENIVIGYMVWWLKEKKAKGWP